MSPTPANDAARTYVQALLQARQRNLVIRAQAQARLLAGWAQALIDVATDALDPESPITQVRAQALRQQVRAVLRRLEELAGSTTAAGITTTVDAVLVAQREALEQAARQAGVDLAVAGRFDAVQEQALAALALRRGAADFRSLVRYEFAAEQLDRMIGSAVARGVGSGRLARDMAALLANGNPVLTAATRQLAAATRRLPPQLSLGGFAGELAQGVGTINFEAYGISPGAVKEVRMLYYNARRVAVSETNNSLREANTAALQQQPVVLAASWQVSGRHAGLPSSPDICDVFAEQDLYGYGPGLYAPEKFPAGAHSHCGCYQGGPVQVRPPSQWLDPRPAPNRPRVNPMDPSLTARYAGDWTEHARQQIQKQVASMVTDLEDAWARRAA